MSSNGRTQPYALAAPDASRVPIGDLISNQPLGRQRRMSFLGFTPEDLSSLLREVERGQLESWADLTTFMMRTDAHLRSVVDTRMLSISGARWSLEPGPGADEALAEDAAEFCRLSLERVDNWRETIHQILWAYYVGYSVVEHDWQRLGGAWHSVSPVGVPSRDIAFSPDWDIRLRSWPEGRPEWIDVADTNPARFMVHVPGAAHSQPHMSGCLLGVVWEWLFKRWSVVFRSEGMERFANPKVWGKLPVNADAKALDEMLAGLKALSSDHYAVFQEGASIEIDATGTTGAGDAFAKAIADYDAAISKGILGSTLNVEIGSTGGNRAAAESQSENTILPRLVADAEGVQNVIERQWLAPLLRFNAARWGRVPPTPRFSFELVQEDVETAVGPLVLQTAINAGVLTKDELRQIIGREPWGPERGGEEIAVLEKAPSPFDQPAFSKDQDVEDATVPEVTTPRPFARKPTQLPLPGTARKRTGSSLTRSGSPSRIARLRCGSSGDPG